MGKNLKQKLIDREQTFRERVCKTLNVRDEDIASMFGEKYSCVRVNNLKFIPEEITKKIKVLAELEEVPWAKDTFVIKSGKEKLTHNEMFERGAYYIQNLSSLLPVIALDPKPGENILDVCAAPGGKTTYIAQLTNNQAKIYINDESHTRLMRTKQLCNNYGAELQEVFNQPAQYLTKHLEIKFDAILIDAPCSGEGLININKPESLQYWSTKKINRLKKLQKRILDEAYKLLKDGGRIVYATCTTAPEENEEVISKLLKTYKDIKLVDCNLPIKNVIEVSKVVHVIPDNVMQSFTISKLIKQ